MEPTECAQIDEHGDDYRGAGVADGAGLDACPCSQAPARGPRPAPAPDNASAACLCCRRAPNSQSYSPAPALHGLFGLFTVQAPGRPSRLHPNSRCRWRRQSLVKSSSKAAAQGSGGQGWKVSRPSCRQVIRTASNTVPGYSDCLSSIGVSVASAQGSCPGLEVGGFSQPTTVPTIGHATSPGTLGQISLERYMEIPDRPGATRQRPNHNRRPRPSVPRVLDATSCRPALARAGPNRVEISHPAAPMAAAVGQPGRATLGGTVNSEDFSTVMPSGLRSCSSPEASRTPRRNR
jgi:hypothetical protein